ncbi:conjugative transposon protein TcpC [Ureibacillus xyleni]|uniref:Conjugative transposon protein TcpC n=1 Tax=Ureibacillus xyleni TaxID=614648 RepID=A0A285THJ5_9BACL|nr:conjugal transfer protein [Ureibacillus xyleni]SOC21553.1 conjugative transposon protein TcpC [Ureibacillus xyleni]
MAKESKTKVLFKGLKRLSDDEKEKAEQKKLERKNKKLNDFTPKGYRAKRMGVYTFWTLFIGMFLFVGLLVVANATSNAEEVEKVEINKVTSQEAVVFAQNFVEAYFTWSATDEGIVARQNELKRYLATGLDSNAGLVVDGLIWSSSYVNSEVRDVQALDEEVGQITFYVKSKLTKGEQEQVSEKYFVVPVAYDGKTFGVYELPKYTHFEEHTTIKSVSNKRLKSVSSEETTTLNSFIETFFKTYADGEREQLNYLLSKSGSIEGLNGTFSIKELNQVEVFKDEDNDTYIAFVEVTLVDPKTEISTKSNYQLTMTKSNDKYIVKAMDDLTGKEIKSKTAEEISKELLIETQAIEEADAKAAATPVSAKSEQ